MANVSWYIAFNHGGGGWLGAHVHMSYTMHARTTGYARMWDHASDERGRRVSGCIDALLVRARDPCTCVGYKYRLCPKTEALTEEVRTHAGIQL